MFKILLNLTEFNLQVLIDYEKCCFQLLKPYLVKITLHEIDGDGD